MPKGLQHKGIIRRNKMLYAAVQLFLENGYEKTTTASIAKAAGMAPSSFFAAFENKEALLPVSYTHLDVYKRQFTDFTIDTFTDFVQGIHNLRIEEHWITGDVRPGRGEEKWLNLILQKK